MTSSTSNLGSRPKIIELVVLNVQGDGAKATLLKSGVLRPDG